MNPPMPASPQELFAYLDSLGIAHQTVNHPPVFTVEEARTLRGASPAGTPKTCSSATRRARCTWWWRRGRRDRAQIAASAVGASGRFSFGSAELLRETLGVEPGSVTPFAAINDPAGRVMVVLDAAMMAHDVLNFHPLVNTGTTTISRQGLLKFLEATGHRPRIEAVSVPPA